MTRQADNPRDFDHDRIEFCDVCKSEQNGTEHYCNDAAGIATPVLWTCHRCANPPLLVGWWRKAKRRVTRAYEIAHYNLTVPKAERDRRVVQRYKLLCRINERRAERGDKPVEVPPNMARTIARLGL